ncbi:hypothetical protein ACJIZ3_022694 [Penstemon smallii]|uniref:Uncharacterized protein n=1 Tax=Penstemon smallii TaxID=265156 RepID=A0ABD3TNU0_9LAMI
MREVKKMKRHKSDQKGT